MQIGVLFTVILHTISRNVVQWLAMPQTDVFGTQARDFKLRSEIGKSMASVFDRQKLSYTISRQRRAVARSEMQVELTS